MFRYLKPYKVAAGSAVLLLAAAGGTAAAAADGTAASLPQQLPSAQEVIEHHIEAVGGRAAIEAHSSTQVTGIIEVVGQGLVGTLLIYGAAPNLTVVSLSFADVGIESRTGYNGEIGWSVESMMGERVLEGGELQQLVDEANYYSDLHEAANFSSMEMLEMVDFAGRPSYKLRLVYLSGREVIEYFDVENGLLTGVEGIQESIMGPMNVVSTVGEYQRFDDVMVPTSVLQRLGPGQTVQITIQSVEHDNVDPSVFELPAAIKALIGRSRSLRDALRSPG